MNATPVVYSAGVLRFYQSGTSTPANVYANSDLTGASTTITLNSAGRPAQDIFLSDALYKVTLEDSLGNIIWTADPCMTSDYTTTAKVTGYSGNPNTHVAGTASAGAVPADMVWDRTNNVLYLCTVTGNAAGAVWTVANVTQLSNWTTAGRNVSPTAGVDFGFNTTLDRIEYWNGIAWVGVGQRATAYSSTAAGDIEYDGKALAYNPVASNRGIVPSMHFLSLSADQTGQNVNTAQTWFPGGGATQITLPASTSYFFEGKLYLARTAGTTSHTTSFLFGGTATFTSINGICYATNSTGGVPVIVSPVNTKIDVATATAVVGASTSSTENNVIEVSGIMRMNGAGTVIPQFIYSAAPGQAPTIKQNSYFRLFPIGSDTVLNVGNWS